ncbi:MAG TPA: glycosyltransferase family 9 protein, partial [Stellaceae bacterium]|nr:glycosyltransferase family 9 protein [Stellaceae bacterium]
TALTTPPFRELLAASPYFDDVMTDKRPKPWRIGRWLRVAKQLRRGHFDRVYDLQRNQRTAVLYRVLGGGREIEWSGVIPGCSHFVRDDPADRRHIADRLEEQLAAAGIAESLPADFSWLTGDVGRFALPPAYVLLVPGGAPRRPEKRAPVAAFAALARHLLGQGIAPVLIGTDAEREQIDAILRECPGAVGLCNRTGFGDIADLARGAVGAVGNDTGAMHLAAAVDCPSLVLFSPASDPRRIAPRGRRVRILQADPLTALPGARLIAGWDALLGEDQATGAPPAILR